MKRVFLIIALLVPVILAKAVYGDEIKVKTSGGTQKIGSKGDDELTYYSLSALNEIIAGIIEWDKPGYSVRLTIDSDTFHFFAGSPYISLNDSVFNILLPAKISSGWFILLLKASSMSSRSLSFFWARGISMPKAEDILRLFN